MTYQPPKNQNIALPCPGNKFNNSVQIMLTILLFSVSTNVMAVDQVEVFDIDVALRYYKKSKIYSGGVVLHFGDSSNIEIEEKFDTQSFARRTATSVQKERDDSDKDIRAKFQAICSYVFSSVIYRMKQHALEKGADAIINIVTNYKNIKHDDASEYQCVKGAFLTAVALKGDYVKLKQ